MLFQLLHYFCILFVGLVVDQEHRFAAVHIRGWFYLHLVSVILVGKHPTTIHFMVITVKQTLHLKQLCMRDEFCQFLEVKCC